MLIYKPANYHVGNLCATGGKSITSSSREPYLKCENLPTLLRFLF